jgi:hypothetical protein
LRVFSFLCFRVCFFSRAAVWEELQKRPRLIVVPSLISSRRPKLLLACATLLAYLFSLHVPLGSRQGKAFRI